MGGRPLRAGIAALLLLAGCHRGAPAGGPAVGGAWVRLPAVPGRPAAAYFALTGGATPDRLIAVESPSAARAELHEGGMSGGMMTMRPIAGIDLPAGGRVAFAPGGNHVMLYAVDPSLRPGGAMKLRFRFGSGTAREVPAKLVAAGDPAPGR